MARPQSSGQPESDQQRQLKLICLNSLLAATEERVFFKDLLSRFLFVSAGWIAAYAPGRTTQDLAGKTDFDIFSFAHANAARQDEQQIIRTGRAIVGRVQQETFKGRPDAWVTTTKMPLRDERGQIVGTFGISRADHGTQRPHPAPLTVDSGPAAAPRRQAAFLHVRGHTARPSAGDQYRHRSL
jgi:PAS domain-containing protein